MYRSADAGSPLVGDRDSHVILVSRKTCFYRAELTQSTVEPLVDIRCRIHGRADARARCLDESAQSRRVLCRTRNRDGASGSMSGVGRVRGVKGSRNRSAVEGTSLQDVQLVE